MTAQVLVKRWSQAFSLSFHMVKSVFPAVNRKKYYNFLLQALCWSKQKNIKLVTEWNNVSGSVKASFVTISQGVNVLIILSDSITAASRSD